MGQAMYSQPGAEGAPGAEGGAPGGDPSAAGGAGAAGSDPNVVDAEFTDADKSDKGKDSK